MASPPAERSVFRVYTVPDTAQVLGTTPSAVRDRMSRGTLPHWPKGASSLELFVVAADYVDHVAKQPSTLTGEWVFLPSPQGNPAVLEELEGILRLQARLDAGDDLDQALAAGDDIEVMQQRLAEALDRNHTLVAEREDLTGQLEHERTLRASAEEFLERLLAERRSTASR